MPNQTGGSQAPDNYGGGTGGAQAPTNYGGNTNQGEGVARPPKGKKRRRNGQIEYQWRNGTWHTRQQGKQFRSNAGDGVAGGGSSGDGGTGGAQAPDAKPKVGPYLRAARNDARLAYGGAEDSLNQRGAAIPTWFQNYRNQMAQAQAASQNYATPIIANAQQQAQQAGQVAPGLDPNSQASQDAQLAAAARAALGNSFVSVLQGNQQLQNNYMAGRQAVASTAEVGEQSQLARDRTSLKREKGAFIQTQRLKRRDDAQTKKLEAAAFGLDVAEETNRHNEKLNEVITSGPFAGYTKNEVRKLSPDEKTKLKKKSTTPSSVITSGAFAGYTQAQLRKMGEAEKKRLIASYKDDKGSEDKSGKDKFGNTPVQRRAHNNDWRGSRSWLKARSKAFLADKDLAIGALMDERNVDYDVAVIAYAATVRGVLTPAQAKKLRRLGIKFDHGLVHQTTFAPETNSGTNADTDSYGNNKP